MVNFFCGCADLRKGALIIGIIKLVRVFVQFFAQILNDNNHQALFWLRFLMIKLDPKVMSVVQGIIGIVALAGAGLEPGPPRGVMGLP